MTQGLRELEKFDNYLCFPGKEWAATCKVAETARRSHSFSSCRRFNYRSCSVPMSSFAFRQR